MKAKNITKVWNSSEVFFSYIIYYKILCVFLQWIFRSVNFIFVYLFWKNIRTMITILTLQQYHNEISYCSKILFIMFWTDIARFLQYFWNRSDSFKNILAILQEWNISSIFPQYWGVTVHSFLFKSWAGWRKYDCDLRCDLCARLNWRNLSRLQGYRAHLIEDSRNSSSCTELD